LQNILIKSDIKRPIKMFDDVATALAAACIDADKNDRIIVFGSFYTVAGAMTTMQSVSL
jgi:dihydrofolate synthase/folylpolyglutamate synthase